MDRATLRKTAQAQGATTETGGGTYDWFFFPSEAKLLAFRPRCPWGTTYGGQVAKKGYALTIHYDMMNAELDLVAACEALHDALSNILEDCASADREGEIQHVHGNEYEIGRDHRAQALRAIRKSFRALFNAKGDI